MQLTSSGVTALFFLAYK